MNGPGIGSWPARRARMNPASTAMFTDDESLTYADLAARVEATAAHLRELGVAAGERVAYLGPNSIDTFVCFFATARLGGVFVSLNTRLAAPEISYMLADSGSVVLVHGPECAELAHAADPAAHGVKHVLSAADLRDATGPVAVMWPDRLVDLDDPALILYTSGTTGRPKGAVLTHGNITWNTVNQLVHVDVLGSDVALCVAPLFHVTGLGQVSLPTLLKGGTVVVVPKFDAGGFLALIEARRATSFSAVPTMLKMLCDHPDWAEADLSSLRYVLYGGSPVEQRVAQAWLDRGVVLQQGYGMTEAAPGVFMALPEGADARPTSPGVPHFFTDVEVLTAEGTHLAGAGQGELLVRGPHVFGGYWERPDESAAVLSPEGWYRSGDVVRIDDDGWAHIVDRVKDVIISGGENIYPAEVEAAIAELADVHGAAVVAVPDQQWGEVGCAYVVLRPGADLDELALRAHLDQRLARYKIPRYVELARRAAHQRDRQGAPRIAAGAGPARPSIPHRPDGDSMTTIAHPKDLLTMIGQDLGSSPWLEVGQDRINVFADATDDHQWIHVDVERAKTGPFGGPIAHGYLTLSLLIPLWSEILVIEDLDLAVNYGLNKVRFPAPVPAGARVQVSASLANAEEVGGNGIQATIDTVMRVEGADKPVCIAQMVHRYYKD